MRSPLAPPPAPGFVHVVASVLLFASWVTLMAFIGMDYLDFQVPSAFTDYLIAIPALFRAVAAVLFIWRGTKLGWGMAAIEVVLFYLVVTDAPGRVKGHTLLLSILMSSVVPGFWALRHRRWSTPFGILGSLLALLALHADVMRPSWYPRDLLLVFVIGSILCGWAMHLGLIVWVLVDWRSRTRDEAEVL